MARIVFMYIHIHTCVYIYMCMYMYYIYIYVYTHKKLSNNKLILKVQVRKLFHISYPRVLYNPLSGLYIITIISSLSS